MNQQTTYRIGSVGLCLLFLQCAGGAKKTLLESGKPLDTTIEHAGLDGQDVASQDTSSYTDFSGPEFDSQDFYNPDLADLEEETLLHDAAEFKQNDQTDAGDVQTEAIQPNQYAELFIGICQKYCIKAQECELNGEAQKCQIDCFEKLLDTPQLMANYACTISLDNCDLVDFCWLEQPLVSFPGCGDLCLYVIECGVTQLWKIPPDAWVCERYCTGAFTPYGATASMALECATGALSNDCDTVAMVDCFTKPQQQCTGLCDELFDLCALEQGFTELFGSYDDCIETCQDYSTGQRMALKACIDTAGCSSATNCEAIPDEPAEGCPEFCDQLAELCAGTAVSGTLCDWGCTGLVLGAPQADPIAGAECLASMDQCPEDPWKAFFGCSIIGKCSLMCDKVEECGPETAYHDMFPDPVVCQQKCEGYEVQDATVAGMCLLLTTCDDIEKCFDFPQEPPQGCNSYCDLVASICPDSVITQIYDCIDLCTGVTLAFPFANPGEGEKCLDMFDQCPQNEFEPLLACAITPSDECEGICNSFADCNIILDQDGELPDIECYVLCSYIESYYPAYFQTLKGCIEDAVDCQVMATCVPSQ